MYLNKFLSLFLISSTFILSLSAYPNISQAVKEKKIYPMGQKIYEKKCKNITLGNYKSYDTLETDIVDKKICGDLNRKHSQALALYLWDVKKASKSEHKHKEIHITKDDKCQVCGMYLHYYPNWASEIDYPKGEIYKFDGIKDMMKFYFNNKEGITDILVKDYYTLETIDAKKAYFVIGSDVLGPMGNELIAFSSKESAKSFLLEHNGKHLFSFNELTEKMVRSLD